MNHKKERAKNQRAGCLICKPNKMNGWGKGAFGHKGFGKLRKLFHANSDLKNI